MTKMLFRYLTLLAFSIQIISCSNGQTMEKFENKLSGINYWNFKIEQGETDTTNLVDWFPNSEINIVFSQTPHNN
jgi:hypothetical protein